MENKVWAVAPDGREMHLYTLVNGAMKAEVTDAGATLLSLYVPDKNGKCDSVVLRHGDPASYGVNPGYLGASVGRVGNRICGGKFTVGENTYQVPLNDGDNCLHGGPEGFTLKNWIAHQVSENAITFTLFSPDGEMGFPGNMVTSVTYTLTENSLKISYHVLCDKACPVSLTNHSYFNLAGEGTILDHELMLNCSRYTPGDAGLLPTGELRCVKGTAFDFTTAKPIGRDIGADDEQLVLAGGYDHNFCIDAPGLFARVTDPKSGRVMECFTDLPGVQLYTANMIAKSPTPGPDGKPYVKHSALCLETQFYPDSINKAQFPTCLLQAGVPFASETEYRFTVL